MQNTAVQFYENCEPIHIAAIQNLLDLYAFWAEKRSEKGLSIALANSNPVLTVWANEQLIGFGRATSDCVYRASIWDVVIHPKYRGLGLGSQLVRKLLVHPRLKKVERIYLMTTYQQGFYRQLGFRENTTTTMLKEQRVL